MTRSVCEKSFGKPWKVQSDFNRIVSLFSPMSWLLSPVLLFRFGSPGLGPRAVQDSLFVQERFPLNSSLLCSSGDLFQTDLLHVITATLWNHAALFSDTDLCGFEVFFLGILIERVYWFFHLSEFLFFFFNFKIISIIFILWLHFYISSKCFRHGFQQNEPWRFAAQNSGTLRTMCLTIWRKQLMGTNVSVPKDHSIINAEEEKETSEKRRLTSDGYSRSGLKSRFS